MFLLADLIDNEAAKRAVVLPTDSVLNVAGLSRAARDRGGYRVVDRNGKTIEGIREIDLETGYAWNTRGELVKLDSPLTIAPRETRDDAKYEAKLKSVREEAKAAKLAAAQDAIEQDAEREKLCEAIRQRAIEV